MKGSCEFRVNASNFPKHMIKSLHHECRSSSYPRPPRFPLFVSIVCYPSPPRMLQEQNEDLHNTLRQTVVRMECLGAEFITEHHQLESELQRTRVELSSMMEKFTRSGQIYSAINTNDP